MKRQKYNISYFICCECGNCMPLPRKCSRRRERGHIKSLFCVYCNDIVATKEVRKGDIFVKADGAYIYA